MIHEFKTKKNLAVHSVYPTLKLTFFSQTLVHSDYYKHIDKTFRHLQ